MEKEASNRNLAIGLSLTFAILLVIALVLLSWGSFNDIKGLLVMLCGIVTILLFIEPKSRLIFLNLLVVGFLGLLISFGIGIYTFIDNFDFCP